MPSKRAASNLDAFNEQRSNHIVPLLKRELELCRKRKMEFKTIGLLALHLSDKTKANRSTLLRNPNYSSLLLTYLAAQPGAVSRTPDTTDNPAILQAKLAVARLEASNLKHQLSTAQAQLERLQSGAVTIAGGRVAVNFADAAMTIVNILNRFSDFIKIDRDKRELIDLSARPSQRIIVGRERMAAVVQWMEANQSLPAVRAALIGLQKG